MLRAEHFLDDPPTISTTLVLIGDDASEHLSPMIQRRPGHVAQRANVHREFGAHAQANEQHSANATFAVSTGPEQFHKTVANSAADNGDYPDPTFFPPLPPLTLPSPKHKTPR